MPGWTKPSLNTKFHIDMDWWAEQGRNFRVHLLSHLCAECREQFRNYREADVIDWVDAETAKVSRVDGLWHSLRLCCSQKPSYVDELTPLTTAVFRTFLANGNEPLTPVELAARLNRPAEAILRTIGGARVYDGVRPYRGRG